MFLAGAATGAVTMRFGFPPEKHKPGLAWNEAGREYSLQKFKKELNLTPGQTDEFARIIDDFMTYYQFAQAQMEDVRATGKGKIMKILREDQKEKFEKMMGEANAKR
ncbi:MAG TPA: hypothetical protein VER03_01600 [Bryobacteraceae bacterium]|nr:hypothetical protein [Bryobacteraceae bacterium]